MKKTVAFVCFFLMAGISHAYTNFYARSTGNWGSTNVWGANVFPDTNSIVRIYSGVNVTLTAEGTCAKLVLGEIARMGNMIIDAGILTLHDPANANQWNAIGYSASASVTIKNRGIWNFQNNAWLGLAMGTRGTGIAARTNVLTMYSGEINGPSSITIGRGFATNETGSLAKIDLFGGTITTPSISFGANAPAGTTMIHIYEGAKIVLSADQTAAVAQWESQGKIIPQGGFAGWHLQASFDGTNTTTVCAERDSVFPEITITNVVAMQRAGTKLIDISYDIMSDRTNAVPVGLAVQNGTIDILSTNCTGDAGAVLPGAGKQMVWNMGADWNTNSSLLTYRVYHTYNTNICASTTASSDSRDYTLTVSSSHGTPVPGIGTHTYAWPATVTASVDSAVIENGNDYTCTGWAGTGSIPASGTSNAIGAITLTNLNSSLLWTWSGETVPFTPAAEFTYTTNNGAITITGYIGTNTVVYIPDMINGLTVTRIGDSAFSGCISLTGITIPLVVTNIGNSAFYNCSGLTGNLTIPSKVTDIGNYAFYCCSGLTGNLAIPAGVTTMWGSAFSWCSGLTSITIPASLTSITGTPKFGWCSELTSITVDDLNSAYSSVDGVLYNKAKTQLILCPGGKTGDFVVPNNVTNIAELAFNDCDGLTSVMIPAEVIGIGDYTFNDCDRALITVDNLNPAYCTVDGVLYNKTKTRLIRCSGSKTGDVLIPGSVTNITSFAFHFCPELTSITVDDLNSVYRSLDGVLYNKTKTQLIQCPGGKTGRMIIPASVTNTGVEAFKFCSKLTSITVDDLNSAYSSLDGILYNKSQSQLIVCPGGKTGGMIIPGSVTSIGSSAFWGCSGLTNIVIPAGVTSLGASAFRECSGLTGVYFQDVPPARSSLEFFASPVTVYRPAEATGWPPVPGLWGGRPTALWSPDSDEDADGIPALWELQHFGGTTNANPNAVCANGFNTVHQAYIAGLDPNDPQSALRTSVLSSPSAGSILSWNAASGRVYNVYWSTNLLSGFQSLYTGYTGGTVTDTVHSAAGKCFYKLDVRLP